MLKRALLVGGLGVLSLSLAATLPAHAQDASPEMLQAALQAAVAQRDQALNEGIRLSAQLAMAQREIARIRKELDEAKKAMPAPAPAESAK